ncbi:helix-turn-helix domain-containing protein [Clostridium tertium]|uniref:helix-turn-helix domain-containing protein n=1 Tax=Clostridium tertium TaxID=1559 RepID=UPI0024B3AC89|nr:helix-turn-helix domain-containing protein [Clostridium tertium]MDI9217651.1 helix-turn-helix domain-containing protein [Clostridium tertium]
MRKISDKNLLKYYINKHSIKDILDEEIIEYVQLHLFENEEYILRAEDDLEYYYLLVDGKIKVSYLFENGKSMFLKFYSSFNSIGDIELLKNTKILCNINAIDHAYLIAVPADILRKKFMGNIKFVRHLADSLSDKLYATINNSSYNFVYPLINRLATYLVEHIKDKDYIILNSSFLEISQFLGTTYRHLNRTFKELELKSIIRCDNKKIYILDEKRLRELSKSMFIKSL